MPGRADDRFHRLILGSCRNNRLKAIIEQFWDQSHRVRMLTLRLRPKPSGSNADHRLLVDAIERRDPETARRIHHEHRAKSGRMLVEIDRASRPQPALISTQLPSVAADRPPAASTLLASLALL